MLLTACGSARAKMAENESQAARGNRNDISSIAGRLLTSAVENARARHRDAACADTGASCGNQCLLLWRAPIREGAGAKSEKSGGGGCSSIGVVMSNSQQMPTSILPYRTAMYSPASLYIIACLYTKEERSQLASTDIW